MNRFAIALLAVSSLFAADSPADKLTKEVRHQLVTLSLYTVFDNLAYRVDGNSVTLFGQVVNPVLKTDAEKSVKSIEGVGRVDNEIEVLPLSANDNRIRRDIFRAIYSRPGFDRYGVQAVPPIHIIVKNGNVTLAGAIATEVDKVIAGMAANGVSGVFSVKNELTVDRPGRG